jgi:hypothetical protein
VKNWLIGILVINGIALAFLSHLNLFHIWLRKNNLTTYEYILTKRELQNLKKKFKVKANPNIKERINFRRGVPQGSSGSWVQF